MIPFRYMIFLLATLILLGGCVSSPKIPVNSLHNVTKLDFSSSFKLGIPNTANNAPRHSSDYPFYSNTNDLDDYDINKYWQEILPAGYKTSSNPDYHFKIDFLHFLNVHLREPFTTVDVQYRGTIFKLTVFDKGKRIIHKKTFQMKALWVIRSLFGSWEGPIKVGSGFITADVPIKMALSDILKYISKKSFLTESSGGVIHITHASPKEQFHIVPNNVLRKGNNENEVRYIPGGAAVLYLQYIMGREITSVKQVEDISWSVEFNQFLPGLAKLAKQKKWPMFPEKLDTNNIRIKVN